MNLTNMTEHSTGQKSAVQHDVSVSALIQNFSKQPDKKNIQNLKWKTMKRSVPLLN